MRPIFTIHAGEYIVASQIEKSLKEINVWLPSKDTGVDLLLTNRTNKKAISIQVKFSKDFNTTYAKETLRPNIKGAGWWSLNKEKIKNSQANYWAFVLYSFENKTHDIIIIKPNELLKMFGNIGRKVSVNKKGVETFQCYITVTKQNKAFETRELSVKDRILISDNQYKNKQRNLTKYLNKWDKIKQQLK